MNPKLTIHILIYFQNVIVYFTTLPVSELYKIYESRINK